MNKPSIDTSYLDFENALYVRMIEDYTTSTFCLGERTYVNGLIYRVDSHMLAEIEAKGVGQKFKDKDCRVDVTTGRKIIPVVHRVGRPKVAILSKVSRWFTANGQDTHHLIAGEVSHVPSNLAAWLVQADHAQFA